MSTPNTLQSQELTDFIATTAATLIDIRQQDAFDAAHIPGATHLPLPTLMGSLDQLDKSKPIVIYCYKGISSLQAATLLATSGFNVYSLEGGFDAWHASQDN